MRRWLPLVILALGDRDRAGGVAAGLTSAEADAVTADYTDAQLDALKKAMFAVALLAVLSLLFTRRLPGKPAPGASLAP